MLNPKQFRKAQGPGPKLVSQKKLHHDVDSLAHELAKARVSKDPARIQHKTAEINRVNRFKQKADSIAAKRNPKSNLPFAKEVELVKARREVNKHGQYWKDRPETQQYYRVKEEVAASDYAKANRDHFYRGDIDIRGKKRK